jgi:dephospho-CoA kinase
VRVVGLTGGIGSGKSAAAAMLAARGVPVIDADAISRRCVEPGSPVLEAIVRRFGEDILLPSGALDRAALAAVVFNDVGARRDLEGLTHPCIRTGIETGLQSLREAPRPPLLAVVEHPLLVETGAHERVDVVVVVEAPLEVRIARLMSARGMSEEDVLARVASQAGEAERRAVADHILDNSGDVEALECEIERLLVQLRGGGT